MCARAQFSTRDRRIGGRRTDRRTDVARARKIKKKKNKTKRRNLVIIVIIIGNFFIALSLQQQRPDLPRLLQQMHAQQLPPGAAMGPHPGIPGLPGLGPTAGIPVPTSASAALLGLGLPPGAGATPGGAAHPLSMLTKPDLHRGQPDDLKPNGGKPPFVLLVGSYPADL